MDAMIEKGLAPKYIILRERLRQEILNGALKPGTRLPHENELMLKFQCSRAPVLRALGDLAGEGLIERKWGVGTFVKQQIASVSAKALVGLVMQSTRGHVYSSLTNALVERLQELGLQTLIAVYGQPESAAAEKTERLIREILANKPAALIINGSNPVPFDALKAHRAGIPHLFIIFRDDADMDIKAGRVLTDDEHGGLIGTRHLLQTGRREIVFILPGRRPPSADTTKQRFLNGCKKAFSEQGLAWRDDRALVLNAEDRAGNQAALAPLFSRPPRPDAIFAFMDYSAVVVNEILRELKIRIPEDVAVLGYYNTPWAETHVPPLSSIAVRETEIGRKMAERVSAALRNPLQPEKTILIKPELVIRASTGPAAGLDKTPA